MHLLSVINDEDEIIVIPEAGPGAQRRQAQGRCGGRKAALIRQGGERPGAARVGAGAGKPLAARTATHQGGAALNWPRATSYGHSNGQRDHEHMTLRGSEMLPVVQSDQHNEFRVISPGMSL